MAGIQLLNAVLNFDLASFNDNLQKGKTSLDLNEARDDGVWGVQWHQVDRTQTMRTSLQT